MLTLWDKHGTRQIRQLMLSVNQDPRLKQPGPPGFGMSMAPSRCTVFTEHGSVRGTVFTKHGSWGTWARFWGTILPREVDETGVLL